MLETLRTLLRFSVRFLTLAALLAAAFGAGRALAAPTRLSDTPMILTHISNGRVCGRPVDATSNAIKCLPEATELEPTFVNPTDLVVSSVASCALDQGEWKCWAISTNANVTQVKMFLGGDSRNVVTAGNSLCHVDKKNGLVSCSQNYGWMASPLRLTSSQAPSIYGDHFGLFRNLTAAAGAPGLLCFIADDLLKCVNDNTRGPMSPKQLKNGSLVAIGAASVCVIEDSGLRCFAQFGEEKQRARPSWKGAKKLVANGYDLCAILATGDVECSDLGPILANSTSLQKSMPDDLGSVVDLGLGKGFACALRADASVRCWSDGSAIAYAPSTDLTKIKKIAVGEKHACALSEAGTISCWGQGESTQTMPFLRAGTPVEIAESGNIKCAWNSGGARCVDGYAYSTPTDVVAKMPLLRNVVSISLSPGYAKSACAITTVDGVNRATCWGSGSAELMKGAEALANPASIALGDESACAILVDGTARCWGKTLGLPWNLVPKAVTQIDVATDRMCMIDYFGFVCYGSKLGLSPLATPERFRSEPDVQQFALGSKHTCVRTSSEVACWGDGSSGQLEVPPLSEPISVIAADDTTCASDSAGVVCWGAGFRESPVVSRPPRWRNEHIPPLIR